MPTDNFFFYLLAISFLIVVLCWAYLPGRKLFFRSDDWEMMSVLEEKMRTFRGAMEFISGTKHWFTKHFYPIGNIILLMKYMVLGNKFLSQFLFSLFFHILNVFLVFLVGFKLSSNYLVGLMGAILFGFTYIIIDAVIWGIMFFNLVCVSAILTSILFNPFLTDSALTTNILFYMSLFAAPLIYETGLLAPVIALSICFINKQFDAVTISVLIMPIAIYFIGRRFVNGSLGMYNRKDGSKSGALAFLGMRKSILHIAVGMIKIVMSFFSSRFKIKIYEAVFILNPDFKRTVTVLASLMTVYLVYCAYEFVISPDISTTLKLYIVVFPLITCAHFLMLSFNVQPWYRYYDPVRQASTTPHQIYSPAAFMAIPVAYIIINHNNIAVFLILVLFIVTNGVFSIRELISKIRPYTDDMRNSVEFFINKGYLPYRGRRYLMEHYRLDGFFAADVITGYLRLKDKRFGDLKCGEMFWQNEFISLLHNVDILWDFYKISKVLSVYKSNSLLNLENLNGLLESVLSILNINIDDISVVDRSYLLTFQGIESKILEPYVKKMVLSLRKIDDVKIKIEIKYLYLSKNIEIDFLTPNIQRILSLLHNEDTASNEKIVALFSERDEELGSYVKSFLNQ